MSQDTPGSISLLDGAAGPPEPSTSEFETCRRIASDPAKTIDERLEAYEDLAASEVGDTPLARARNVERDSGIRQLYLKTEGGNPTGTQKDRIAFAQVYDALRRGFDTVTVATCGNYGAAVAFAASLAGLRCVIFIPESYHTSRLEEMTRAGVEIRRIRGGYESAVEASQGAARNHEWYDGNPGGANTILQLVAYGEIANEIYDELRDAPAIVAVSVSNGTTLAGIHRGFTRLHRRGKTSHIPRIIAGSSHGKNSIVHSYLKQYPECRDLDPSTVRETAVNEPLINWHSFDGDWALSAIRDSGGFAADVSDKEMLRRARMLRKLEGLSVLPASTAGLATLLDHHSRNPLPGDRYVAILTGRR